MSRFARAVPHLIGSGSRMTSFKHRKHRKRAKDTRRKKKDKIRQAAAKAKRR